MRNDKGVMVKLGKREKILAVAFVSFLLLWITEKVVIVPFSTKFETVNVEIEARERKFEKLFSIGLMKEDILANFDTIKPYIEIAKTEEGTLSAIMKKVEEMATSCKITVLNMKPDTEPVMTKPAYITKKTELSIEGSQSDIIKFLYTLENSHYSLTIKRLDFKVKDRDKNLMEADLEMHFIYFL